MFHRLPSWDGEAVVTLFRERLLARLVERHAITKDLARKLVAWPHRQVPGPLQLGLGLEDLSAARARGAGS